MYRTIILGSCFAVQGLFLKKLAGGMIAIKIGDKIYQGQPIETYAG